MNCPICGKSHRKQATAMKCLSEARNECYHATFPYMYGKSESKLKEEYESKNTLYCKMKEYFDSLPS